MVLFIPGNVALVSLLLLFGGAVVTADPPPTPECRVFCFRITDIRCSKELLNETNSGKFHFEFEVLNWADVWVGGVDLSVSRESSAGIKFDPNPLMGGIDSDGRPIQLEDVNNDGVIDTGDNEDTITFDGIIETGEDQNLNGRFDNDPIPGNLRRANDWILEAATDSRLQWSMGDTGTPIPFINLIDAPDPSAGSDTCPCIGDLPTRGAPATSFISGVGDIEPTELIDNGDNVLDGFVMTIDGFQSAGRTAVLNWFLKGSGETGETVEDTPPASTCRIPRASTDGVLPDGVLELGDLVGTSNGTGNIMGFGLVTLARVDDQPLPEPDINNTTGVSNSSVNFYDNVFVVPGCRFDGGPAIFALEFSAGKTCASESLPVGAGCNCRPNRAHCGGDPHFTTWTGETYSFHGECDMVIVRNPHFDGGKGMHIHGRSKLHRDWSAFESAAIQIGDDILEVMGDSYYWINGVRNASFPVTLGGYEVTSESVNRRLRNKSSVRIRKLYHVKLGQGRGQVTIKASKSYIFVQIEDIRDSDFAGSDGLLGSFETGEWLARNGATIFEDHNEFGQEWQVRAAAGGGDPMLFHRKVGPQYPGKKCKLPASGANTKATERIRRLRSASAGGEDLYARAEQVCMDAEGVTVGTLDNCIADIMQTGDFDLY